LPEKRKEYVSGETILYSGRQYRLKVVQSKEESVKLKGRYIYISCLKKDKKRIGLLLEN
jgi:hypothetical protein